MIFCKSTPWSPENQALSGAGGISQKGGTYYWVLLANYPVQAITKKNMFV